MTRTHPTRTWSTLTGVLVLGAVLLLALRWLSGDRAPRLQGEAPSSDARAAPARPDLRPAESAPEPSAPAVDPRAPAPTSAAPERPRGRELVVFLRDETGAAIDMLETQLDLISSSGPRAAPYRSGAARFPDLPVDRYEVRYGGTDVLLLGDTQVEVRGDPGTIEVVLTAASTWTVTVVVQREEAPEPRTATGPDGRTAVTWPGPPRVTVAGYAPDPGSEVPRWITRASDVSATPVARETRLQVLRPVREFELCVARSAWVFHRELVVWPTARVVVPFPDPSAGPTAAVRFRVRDADGTVPPSASLSLLADSLGGSSVAAATPSADGSGRFQGLAPHVPHQLEIRAEGHALLRRTFVLRPDEDRDLGTLVLQRAATLSGEIRGSGDEVVRRRVTILPLSWACDEREVLTDEDGRFEAADLEPGRYAVAVSSVTDRPPPSLPVRGPVQADASRASVVDLPAEGAADVVLLLEPSPPLTLRAPLSAVFPTQVLVRDATGTPVARGPCRPDGLWLRCLPVGAYSVRVEAGEIALESEVTMLEGGVELVFPP